MPRNINRMAAILAALDYASRARDALDDLANTLSRIKGLSRARFDVEGAISDLDEMIDYIEGLDS